MEVIIFCNNEDHPCISRLKDLSIELTNEGKKCSLVTSKLSDQKGDLCFLVSCSQIINKNVIGNFKKVFVLHCSDLPHGRGWSPYAWEILNGSDLLTMSLIEANEKVDTGDIWLQEKIPLNGSELLNEIMEKVISSELSLIRKCINNFGQIIPKRQKGEGVSYFPKRGPEHSELDIHKSIFQQFNLLRIVDNQRFPAFFVINGVKYFVKISRD